MNASTTRKLAASAFALLTAVFAPALPALAQSAYDTPSISVSDAGEGKVALLVTAGPSGAPNGFTVWWMKQSDFAANGGQWFTGVDSRQSGAYFFGQPTLNTDDGSYFSFDLGPNQSIEIE